MALRKEYAFIFKSHQRGLSCLDGTGPCQEEDLCGQLCAYVGQVNNQKWISNSTIKLTVSRFDFDGLDFDWEYPGSRPGSDPEHDKEDFTLLIQENN